MADLRTRTVVLTIGGVAGTGGALVAAAVLSHILDKHVYGTYRQAFFAYRFVQGVLWLNVAASMLYFLPRAEPEDRPRFVGQSVLITLAVGLVVAAVLACGAEPIGWVMSNPALGGLLLILVPYALLNQLTLLVPNTLLAVDRVWLVLAYDLTVAAGRFASVVVPFAMGLDLRWVFGVIVAWETVLAALGLGLIRRAVGIAFLPIRRSDVLAQLRYTWPLLAVGLLNILSAFLDRTIIGVAFDARRFAEYTNGALHLPMVILTIKAIHRAVLPEMARRARQAGPADALALFRASAVKGALFVFPVVVFFLLSPDYAVTLLYGERYLISAWPFAIYLAGELARFSTFEVFFQAIGRTGLSIACFLTGLVANVIISIALVAAGLWLGGRGSLLAFTGPAVGTSTSILLCNTLFVILIARVAGRSHREVLPWKALGRVALVVLASAAPTAALRWLPVGTLVKFIAMGGVFFGSYLALGRAANLFSPGDIALMKAPLRGLAAVWRVLRGARPKQPRGEDPS